MLPPNIKNLARELIDRTAAGRIEWLNNYSDDMVSMRNQYFSVRVGYGFDGERGISYYYIDYAAVNDEFKRFYSNQYDEDFELLKQVYEFAVASNIKIPKDW